MEFKIALVKGDGIGPEIVDNAVKVLEEVARQFGHTFTFNAYLAGGCAIDACGVPLPQETIDGCLASDSIMLGAVGGPKWDGLAGEIRPEKALLKLRSVLGLYTNLRPARLYQALREACPLKESTAEKGFDLMMVRELIGGAYFGEHKTVEENGELRAHDDMTYSEHEVRRIAKKRPCDSAKVFSVEREAIVVVRHYGEPRRAGEVPFP